MVHFPSHPRRLLHLIAATLCLLALGACAVRTHVEPIVQPAVISTIYVENNPNVLMDGLLPEIVKQLHDQGFHAVAYTGPRPAEAKNYITFTANWRWHWAMYLSYFRATFWQDDTPVGHAEYDAKHVGPNPAKYGSTAEKIRPLLRELLHNVRPAT